MLGRIGSALALTTIAMLVLAGCTPEEPVESTPPPTASETTPVNDHELATLARESWDSYRERMSNLGSDPGSATLALLQEVATPDVAAAQLENFQDAAERRIHTEGTRRTTAFQLVDTSEAPTNLTVHVCVDLSQERYIGDEGADLTPPDRPDQRASVVKLTLDGDGARYLVADETQITSPEIENPCA